MSSTEPSTSHTAPATDATTATATAPAQPVAATEPHTEEHKKHGLGAVLDKIVHPHGDHHKEHPEHVEVAVPAEASDGGAHLAPGGSGVGGIM